MIAKITTGRGLKSALSYDLDPKTGEPARAAWVAGTLCGTPRQMSRQAAALRGLRPNVAAPVWRCSLSLPASDGRRTPEFWQKISTEFLVEMGVDTEKAAWCAVFHDDRDHAHVHLTLIRCQADGSLFDRANDVKRAIKVTQLLEQRHQLQTHSRDPPPKAGPNLRDQEISNSTGKPMSKLFIQEKIDAFIAAKQGTKFSFEEIQNALRDHVIGATEARTAKGKLQGISFKFDDVALPASALGTEYSTKGLIARGLQIDEFLMAQEKNTETETVKEKEDADNRADDRAHTREQEQDSRQAMIRSSLQPRPRLDLDLQKTTTNIARADIGPVSKVMLVLGMAVLRFSLAALEALLNFVRALLRRFGLQLAPAQPGSAHARTALPFEPRFLDVQSRIIPEPAPPTAIENAANELQKVANALEKNDPGLLPPGQSRDELVAALVAQNSPFSIPPADTKTVEIQAPQEIKQDGLGELFVTPKSPFFRELDKLIDDALAALDRAVKAQADAESRVNDAPKKESEEVHEAKQNLAASEQKLTARRDRHYFEKAEAPKLLKFAFPSVESFSAKEIAAVEGAKTLLATACKAHPAEVPQALNVALLQARLGSISAAGLALNEQKKMLVIMKDGNAELLKIAKYRVDFFATQVQILGHHPSTFFAKLALKSGEDAIKSIAKKRLEIEEAARREVQIALEVSSQKLVP